MNTLRCPNVHFIACDLDDTLVATQKHAESSRQASDEALRKLGSLITNLREQDGQPIYFGSATGRTFGSIQELAAERPAFGDVFNMMDFHIASVGAEIRAQGDCAGDFVRLPDWPNAASWNRPALADRLAAHPNLALQEPEAQDMYKISYTTTSTANTHAAELHAYLDAVNLHANVIVSGSGSWRFVDVLPVDTDKGNALLQLPRLFERPSLGSPTCHVAAGDSMNDTSLLAIADVAIMPNNAQPDLLEWADNQQIGSLYIADECFAAGVLQGLQRHLYGD
ncbi:MAG TPA: HAD family hydrolase [Candidatus Saccharimonadales bacterium]|nr:HAD family hydrolase [Candidatus Saccharimonadales bacterium]